ncbi:pseudouridine synthase [Phellopilus nigrolimitatus]|nr:pseudouridine synthase [Phellopilus nigrolimitatus]
MPKVTFPQLPVSALFGISKPSGPSSMSVINDLKRLVSASRLFIDSKYASINAEKLYTKSKDDDAGEDGEKGKDRGKGKRRKGKGRDFEAKIGQGGTLDPLADGVLVVGVGKGTKKLGEFLDCVKEYRTTCLLGCETDTYDSEGMQVRVAPWRQVTREKLEAALEQFRGQIQQTPPIFSALKMNGKPLYEYARSGTPLPRPIERRAVTVHSLELTHWIPASEHTYRFPEKKFSDEEREKMEKALRGVEISADAVIRDEPEDLSASSKAVEGVAIGDSADAGVLDVPPAFVLTMRVSGGTYVRSIAHDLGHALGSAAHVVTLTRSRQGRFALGPSSNTSTPVIASDSISASAEISKENVGEPDETAEEKKEEQEEKECVPWEIFARALEDGGNEEPDADGWREWEREIMEKIEIVGGAPEK